MRIEYEDHRTGNPNRKKFTVMFYENSLHLYEDDDTRVDNSILSIDDSYDDVITVKMDKRFWVQIENFEEGDTDLAKYVFRAHKDDGE